MKIIIPGIPVSQARMRTRRCKSFNLTYDPCAKEKEKIRLYLRALTANDFFHYPRINFLFEMPIPKSTSKKDTTKFKNHMIKHVKKPDIDNLIKLYLDCLDGIIITGDQKVSLGFAIKIYSETPKTIIWVQETPEYITQSEIYHAV